MYANSLKMFFRNFFNWKQKGNLKSTVYFVGVDADD